MPSFSACVQGASPVFDVVIVVTILFAFAASFTGIAATSEGHCELAPQLPTSPTSDPKALFHSSSVIPFAESAPVIFCKPLNQPSPAVCQPGSISFRKSSTLAA